MVVVSCMTTHLARFGSDMYDDFVRAWPFCMKCISGVGGSLKWQRDEGGKDSPV